jgi:hypothetical protein
MQSDILCTVPEHWYPARQHLHQHIYIGSGRDTSLHPGYISDGLEAIWTSLDWLSVSYWSWGCQLPLHSHDTASLVP